MLHTSYAVKILFIQAAFAPSFFFCAPDKFHQLIFVFLLGLAADPAQDTTIRTVAIFQLREVNFAIANLPAQQSETLRWEMHIKQNHFCAMRRRSSKPEVVLFDAQRCHATIRTVAKI